MASEGKEEANEPHFIKMKAVTSVSVAEEMNARYRASMEDTYHIEDSLAGEEGCAYFAVYDGHGGREVSEFLKLHLHETVAAEIKSKSHPTVEDALSAAYLLTDIKAAETLKETSAGSTAVSCVVRTGKTGQRYVYSANCGDARAVLSSNGKAVRLSLDHKASDTAEVKRIEEAGGFVLRKRVLGVLAVARSFGDFALKKFVPCTPHTSGRKLDATCNFLIIACDGVWDVLSDDEAVTLIREKCGNAANTGSGVQAARAAKHLVDAALSRGSTDNVTALVVFL